MMTKPLSIADVVWQVREKHQITLQQMADRLGCSQPYVTMIELGDRIPSKKWVDRFAQEFGLDKDRLELLCGRVPAGRVEEVCKLLEDG